MGYDASEPRDEQGQWTASGGGSAAQGHNAGTGNRAIADHVAAQHKQAYDPVEHAARYLRETNAAIEAAATQHKQAYDPVAHAVRHLRETNAAVEAVGGKIGGTVRGALKGAGYGAGIGAAAGVAAGALSAVAAGPLGLVTWPLLLATGAFAGGEVGLKLGAAVGGVHGLISRSSAIKAHIAAQHAADTGRS